MISKQVWCVCVCDVCVGVWTRSVSNRGSEEGLGVSQQHRSLLAAAWTGNPARPGIWDQILWEGEVSPPLESMHLHAIRLSFLTETTSFWFLQQEHEQLSYSSTRTKAPSVIISSLKPATWYIFSVRTRTATGYSSYSPKYEYETTGDCKYRPKNHPMYLYLSSLFEQNSCGCPLSFTLSYFSYFLLCLQYFWSLFSLYYIK